MKTSTINVQRCRCPLLLSVPYHRKPRSQLISAYPRHKQPITNKIQQFNPAHFSTTIPFNPSAFSESKAPPLSPDPVAMSSC